MVAAEDPRQLQQQLTAMAQMQDRGCIQVLRGESNYRFNTDLGLQCIEQKFTYEPVVQERAVSHVLSLRFGKRLTATVRLSEYFNSIEALRLLTGEFEINCPSCRRTQHIEYRITQLEVWSPMAPQDPY